MELFNPSNSSLEPWLSYSADRQMPNLTLCLAPVRPTLSANFDSGTVDRENYTMSGCLPYCNNTYAISNSLNDPNDRSLATCGIWLSAVSSCPTPYSLPSPEENISELPLIGNCSNISSEILSYAHTSASVMSSFLQGISYAPVASEASGLCSSGVLFPMPDLANPIDVDFQPNTLILRCLSAICSPSTVDQDLGGIGVSV